MIDSASTILIRGWESPDVYLVLRDARQRAFASTWVFAGGRVDEADCVLEVRGLEAGAPRSCHGAAAREQFEEVGVLLATPRRGGSFDPEVLKAERRALLDGKTTFVEILNRLDAVLDAELLIPLGVKTTPPFAPRRFKNQFFLGVLPAGQEPSVFAEGELERGEWRAAAEWVRAFDAGELLLAPPVLLLLETLAKHGPRAALPELQGFSDEMFAHRPVHIRFSPGLITFPGRTPTLPPATHTNTYVVGNERLLVVDPATNDEADRKKLIMLLDELAAAGRRVEAVFVTHHHHDHTGAVELVARHTGAPVWCHPLCAPRLDVPVARTFTGGETIDLGTAGTVRVIHTPGHTRDHLVLFVERCRDLIAGDMVSTISTIIIDPPEGDLLDYLASLERLRELGARLLHPAHGPPTTRVDTTLRHFVEHRLFREQKVLAALVPEAKPLSELVKTVYSDVDASVHPIAERNLLANLLKLEREGRAVSSGDGAWRRS